jgi:hypothetical protein
MVMVVIRGQIYPSLWGVGAVYVQQYLSLKNMYVNERLEGYLLHMVWHCPVFDMIVPDEEDRDC